MEGKRGSEWVVSLETKTHNEMRRKRLMACAARHGTHLPPTVETRMAAKTALTPNPTAFTNSATRAADLCGQATSKATTAK
jgi:hypothetical protein